MAKTQYLSLNSIDFLLKNENRQIFQKLGYFFEKLKVFLKKLNEIHPKTQDIGDFHHMLPREKCTKKAWFMVYTFPPPKKFRQYKYWLIRSSNILVSYLLTLAVKLWPIQWP